MDHGLEGANWSPDGSQIVTADDGGRVIVWDSTQREDILTFSEDRENARTPPGLPMETRILSTGRLR